MSNSVWNSNFESNRLNIKLWCNRNVLERGLIVSWHSLVGEFGTRNDFTFSTSLHCWNWLVSKLPESDLKNGTCNTRFTHIDSIESTDDHRLSEGFPNCSPVSLDRRAQVSIRTWPSTEAAEDCKNQTHRSTVGEKRELINRKHNFYSKLSN